jgi:hypothetical protein
MPATSRRSVACSDTGGQIGNSFLVSIAYSINVVSNYIIVKREMERRMTLAISSGVGKLLAALVILNLIGMTISAYIILKRKK